MSTMKNHLGSFLSRLLLPALAAPLILLSPAFARATVTTFVVSGTATNTSGMKLDSCASGATCAFSGMFQVDTTTGTLVSGSFDVTLPGLPTFDNVFQSAPVLANWEIFARNSSDQLFLFFTTAPTAGSLVGFTGGSIIAGDADVLSSYLLTGGSITPAPEPSSLILFASGLLALGLSWRFGKKVCHPLSA